jgi:uncharacterized metal-binding protein YceD (DUF177 family)
MSEAAIFSRPVEVARIPAEGVEMEIGANEQERAALAAACELVEVKALSATLTLEPGRKGSVTVSGRVVADIVQTCVVSLVPVDQHIDEPVSVRFVPPGSPDAPKPPKPGAEVVIQADAPEPPEVMTGSAIDVGALAEEIFVLAIDPYPRAPGAALPAEAVEAPESGTDSPFAALADLAKKRRQQG